MKLFSGIQPTNILHIGNYLGALAPWISMQKDNTMIACIVDLHAITVPQKPEELRRNTETIAALYLACGLDPERVTIFVQSHVREHTELAWILNTTTKMGELERMTQFKDKALRQAQGKQDGVSSGLFTYPVLMAADILLYGTEGVPVGEDQKQHVELTRDLALRFNNRFGETFVLPKPLIQKEGARVMGLDDPTKKMSKSASSPNNYISLTDDADTVRAKIKRAVTDSGSEIVAGSDKPALTNLLTIYSLLSGTTILALEKKYKGKGYGDFKKDLAEVVVDFLTPIQERLKKTDVKKIQKILDHGARTAQKIAAKTMEKVRERVGLI
ncbi:tryptophan--tRNA ligase [Candidatus Uhrbacteria bacterium]|nr:tryptophan--tRNA ligase [Candidatus Uhrbacteria bacterium]